jgi:hypothetical protein
MQGLPRTLLKSKRNGYVFFSENEARLANLRSISPNLRQRKKPGQNPKSPINGCWRNLQRDNATPLSSREPLIIRTSPCD